MTPHKFKTVTKNMFAQVVQKNAELLKEEARIRQESFESIKIAAKLVGKLLDEVNACGLKYHLALTTAVSVSVDTESFVDLSMEQPESFVCELKGYFYIPAYAEDNYWKEGDYLQNLSYLQEYQEMMKQCKKDETKKKAWRRFNDLLQALNTINKEWQKIKTVAISTRIEIYSENNVVLNTH